MLQIVLFKMLRVVIFRVCEVALGQSLDLLGLMSYTEVHKSVGTEDDMQKFGGPEDLTNLFRMIMKCLWPRCSSNSKQQP